MKSDSFICIWILVFRIETLEVSTVQIEVFDILSVGYTITELQTSETVKYITRGAK